VNARKLEDACSRLACSVSPYVDGELTPAQVAELDTHLLGCTDCSERVQLLRATRASVRRVARVEASSDLRARMAAVLAAERVRADGVAAQPKDLATGARWKATLPVAVATAAGVALVAGGAIWRARSEEGASPASVLATAAVLSFDSLLDDLVALHAEPLPPEATSVDELPRFEPLVGVSLRRPASLAPLAGAFRGARVHAVRDRRAALLQYLVPGNHRVTMYVFDPAKVPVRPTVLTRRMVHERPVFVGQMRGYTVAATERAGVAYAVASDLPAEQSTQIVASLQ
jgi:anti-sigma factor RsiW